MKNSRIYKNISGKIKELVVSDVSRRRVSFFLLNGALTLTALVMSIVNIITAEYALFVAAFTFSLLCLLNIILLHATRVDERLIYKLFGAESLALLAFFFVSGIPNGFSALWVCLIPSFALLIFGVRVGSAFSALALAMLIFFFWVPFGRSLLLYSYTDEFMLRMPFLYCSVFVISLLIELIRSETQKQLEFIKEKCLRLYRHDALTGLYNRYGINEFLDKTFGADAESAASAAVVIFDIDDFKSINDEYGHECGDEVLREIARILIESACSHCRCCRWGGEEFLLLMQCRHDPALAAEEIRKKIERTEIIYGGSSIHTSVSMGVCIAENPGGVCVRDVVEKADNMLYVSKSNGKNCVTVRSV